MHPRGCRGKLLLWWRGGDPSYQRLDVRVLHGISPQLRLPRILKRALWIPQLHPDLAPPEPGPRVPGLEPDRRIEVGPGVPGWARNPCTRPVQVGLRIGWAS